VLRYSRKHKVGRLDEHLLAEALEAFSAPLAPSMPLFQQPAIVSTSEGWGSVYVWAFSRRGLLASSLGGHLSSKWRGPSPVRNWWVSSLFGPVCTWMSSFAVFFRGG